MDGGFRDGNVDELELTKKYFSNVGTPFLGPSRVCERRISNLSL